MANDGNGRHFDPATRAIFAALRDLRLEMRAERRQSEAGRRRAGAAAAADRRQAEADRRRSDERFEELMHELRAERVGLREDLARRDAVTQKTFKDIHTVGLAIVKTLNRHTRILERHGVILERMDRKLGARINGGPGNGRRA